MHQECGSGLFRGKVATGNQHGVGGTLGFTLLSSLGLFYSHSLISHTEENSEAAETRRVFILSSKSLLPDAATEIMKQKQGVRRDGGRVNI